MNNLPFAKKVTAVKALCEGNSLRVAERIVGAHRDTIMRLGRDVGEGYSRLHDQMFTGIGCDAMEVAVVPSFVGKQQTHVLPGDPDEFGDQCAYLAMDSQHRCLVSYLTAKTNDDVAVAFALDLRNRLVSNPQIFGNKFRPYVKAIGIALDRDIDETKLARLFREPCLLLSTQRSSPERGVHYAVDIVFDDHALGRMTIPWVLKPDLSLRSIGRRFSQLMGGFSKTLRNHAAAMDLHVGWHNLVRPQEALGTVPAVALGITKEPWTPERFVEECLALCDRQHPPVRLGGAHTTGGSRAPQVVCDPLRGGAGAACTGGG